MDRKSFIKFLSAVAFLPYPPEESLEIPAVNPAYTRVGSNLIICWGPCRAGYNAFPIVLKDLISLNVQAVDKHYVPHIIQQVSTGFTMSGMPGYFLAVGTSF